MDFPNNCVTLLIILLSSSIYGLGVSEPLVDNDATSSSSSSGSTSSGGQGHLWNRIEGKLIAPMEKKTNDWLVSTQIMVGRKYYSQIFYGIPYTGKITFFIQNLVIKK